MLLEAHLWQVLWTCCALQQSKYHRLMFLQPPLSDPTYWFPPFWKIHLKKALSFLTPLRALTHTGWSWGPLGISWDPKQLWQEERSGVILSGHVLQVPLPWYWRPNKSLSKPLLPNDTTWKRHSHYRRLPRQTSTPSLFVFHSSTSPSFLQLSSLSAHPSSAWLTPSILNCLSFLRLEKLALDDQSALTQEIRVQ